MGAAYRKQQLRENMLQYRKDIDLLRAISVLAVLIYHAEFTIFNHKALSGGFIGVDVFFVISGYLITSILKRNYEEHGSIKYMVFLEKRSRRILPLYFSVTFSVAFFGLFILHPTQLKEFAESIIWSSLFISNFYFYLTTSIYGAESSLLKPLLHTWSLGVEEQFYLLFPLFLLIILKIKKNVTFIISSFILFWFLVSIFVGRVDYQFNFYLPFSRFWELLFGAILVFLPSVRCQKLLPELIYLCGLSLIVISIFTFSGKTAHPGLATLFPVLGASICVVSGKKSFIADKLATVVLQNIGKLSFSLYMWHFPIMAYARNIDWFETAGQKLLVILIVFCLSFLSLNFIEKPFRDSVKVTRKELCIFLIASFAISIFGAIIIQNIAQNRVTAAKNSSYVRDNQILSSEMNDLQLEIMGQSGASSKGYKNILIMGDSHARDLAVSLYRNNIFGNQYKIQLARNKFNESCSNVVGSEWYEVNQEFLDTELFKSANVVILSSKWRNQKCNLRNIKNDKKYDVLKGLETTLEQILKTGKIVVVLGNKEMFKLTKLPSDEFFDQNGYISNTIDKVHAINSQLFSSRIKKVDVLNAQIEKIVRVINNKNLVYVETKGWLCDYNNRICHNISPNAEKLLLDGEHLTPLGSDFIAPNLKPLVNKIINLN